MLKLESQNCKVEHLNYRQEIHGDETRTAVDLKLSANLPPSVLDQLVPGMREHFFKEANSSGAMRGELALRFPDLVNTYAVDSDIPGYAVAVEWGMNGALVEFADVEVGKIKVELIDGGAVSLSFRVQVAGKPEELARLVPLLNLTLPVTLTPPAETPLPKDHPDSPEAKGKRATKGANADPLAGSDLAGGNVPPDLRKGAAGKSKVPPGIGAATLAGLQEAEQDAKASAERKAARIAAAAGKAAATAH